MILSDDDADGNDYTPVKDVADNVVQQFASLQAVCREKTFDVPSTVGRALSAWLSLVRMPPVDNEEVTKLCKSVSDLKPEVARMDGLRRTAETELASDRTQCVTAEKGLADEREETAALTLDSEELRRKADEAEEVTKIHRRALAKSVYESVIAELQESHHARAVAGANTAVDAESSVATHFRNYLSNAIEILKNAGNLIETRVDNVKPAFVGLAFQLHDVDGETDAQARRTRLMANDTALHVDNRARDGLPDV